LEDISRQEGIDLKRIVRVIFVGNTAILTLLSERNIKLLLDPKYWMEHIDCLFVETSTLAEDWQIFPGAEIEVVPPVAGFVGSDLLAGIWATSLTEKEPGTLLIDFGTNSEMALWDGEYLWVTSAAGGPAFEACGICRIQINAGDQDNSVASAKNLYESGVQREVIVTECIEVAMLRLNDKCTAENFNLLEIMLSGRAVMTVMKDLFPSDKSQPSTKGTVILATMEGDVHDLGKNILKMILIANQYKVIDCGKNCSVEKLINAVKAEEDILVVGISGLITSIIPMVQDVRKILLENNLGHIKIMTGGAALKQSTAESLKVDYLGETAFDGLDYIRSL